MSRMTSTVLAGLLLAVMVVPLATADSGDALREGVRNGTTTRETEIIGRFDASDGPKGGYVTRQSNTQTGPDAGGGAIYGCRGAAGGSATGSAPCLRASNLADGYAFELASRSGPAGLFTVGPADATSATPPFATNATGRVENLNADRLDGAELADLTGPRPPTGPAGGSLTGTYPNPTIADDAVGTAQIADDAVGSAQIGDDAVGNAELASGAVRSEQLGTTIRRAGAFTTVPVNGARTATVACGPGEKILSGGGNWAASSNSALGLALKDSFPAGSTDWFVRGENTGTTTSALQAFALCLAAG